MMNRRVVVLALVALIGAAHEVSANPPPSGNGTLVVTAKPWARVTVDAKPLGNTPLESISLAAGTHAVVLEHPLYKPVRRDVTVTPGETTRLAIDLTRSANRRPEPDATGVPPSDATPRPAASPRPTASPAAEAVSTETPSEAKAKAEARARERAHEKLVALWNVRLDVTLTDRRGSEPPIVKTSTMTLGHNSSGMLRASTDVPQPNGPTRYYQLNLDARPYIEDADHVNMRVTAEYEPQPANGPTTPGFHLKGATNGTVLESGRSITIAEASDPISDRRVTLEVKATILR